MAEPSGKQEHRPSPVKHKAPQELAATPNNAPSPARTMDVAPENSNAASALPQPVMNGVSHEDYAKLRENEVSPLRQLPPEIEHITQAFHPLSELFGRVSQECFNSLNDVISGLSNLGDPPQVNGASAGAASSGSPQASVTRRLRWLDWAHQQRQKFLQLLVILQWSRRAPEVSRLIDVNWWISTQLRAIDQAWDDFGLVKRGASSTVIPGPDINTALDILQGHQQSPFPDLNYLPSKPLQASKILDTIRKLDVLLHIRLNLHEDLPKYLQDYKICDGKVTFKVPNEFEVDLIIADEDPASQFWFVDFRLLFSSVHDIPTGNLAMSIEQRVNGALSTHGLRGCFEVLHEFCITLKISVLRQQGVGLNRAAWAGFLKIDQLNRSLVVQYWCDRTGKKSWIQIGAKRGTPARVQAQDGYWPSKLTLKWMRNGKDTQTPLTVDPAVDTLEQILKSVIAHHTSGLLLAVKQSFDQSSKSLSSTLSPVLFKSDIEPSECALHLSLQSRRNVSVLVEPISGRFVLQPATSAAARFENDLNAADSANAQWANIIEHWLAHEALDRIRQHIDHAEFILEDPPGATRDSIKKGFGRDTIEVIYVRKKYWRPSNWYIAFAAHNNLETVWVVRMTQHNKMVHMNEKYRLDGLNLDAALKQGPDWAAEKLEEIAVARISREVLQRRLRQMDMGASIAQGTVASTSGAAHIAFDIGALLRSHDRIGNSSVLASNRVILILCGFQDSERGARALSFVAKGRLRKSVAQSGALSGIEGGGLSFAADGLFSFTIATDIGSVEPVDRVTSSIRALEQLGMVLNMLWRHQLRWDSARLDGVTFKYAGDDSLARVAFTKSGIPRLEQLMPPFSSSSRIMHRLNELFSTIRDSPASAFGILLRTLILTLPLVRALDALGASDPRATRVRTFTRDLSSFRIEFVLLAADIRINAVQNRGQAYWALQASGLPQHAINFDRSRHFLQAFMKLCATDGQRWRGTRNGIIAKPSAIDEIIQKIDAAALEADGGVKPAVSGGRPPVKQPGLSQQSGSRPGPPSQARPPAQQQGQQGQRQQHPPGQQQNQQANQQQNNRNAPKQNRGGKQGAEVVVID